MSGDTAAGTLLGTVALSDRWRDGLWRLLLGSDHGSEFVESGGSNGNHRWVPAQEHVFTVPREHILGRPLMTFWPPSRIGFIR